MYQLSTRHCCVSVDGQNYLTDTADVMLSSSLLGRVVCHASLLVSQECLPGTAEVMLSSLLEGVVCQASLLVSQ